MARREPASGLLHFNQGSARGSKVLRRADAQRVRRYRPSTLAAVQRRAMMSRSTVPEIGSVPALVSPHEHGRGGPGVATNPRQCLTPGLEAAQRVLSDIEATARVAAASRAARTGTEPDSRGQSAGWTPAFGGGCHGFVLRVIT